MTADPYAEREVDFGRYGRVILARWWLVAAALALGILAGYLLSLGGGTVYRSTATIYLGQPLSPSGGSQIQSLATNPSTINQIVKSPSVTAEVAEELDLPPGRLRGGVSTRAVAGALARQGQTQLVEISVRGPWRREGAQAATRLAEIAVERTSGYVATKIDSLEELLASQNRELEVIDRRIAANESAVAEEGSAERDLIILNLNGLLEQRRGQLFEDRVETRQLLTLAEDVERGRVVVEASPVQVAARSPRNSMIVGGLVGLLAGAAAALLWQRVR